MRKNVVVLTGGLAGSSVVTALLARDGLWPGDQTFKKNDYDTWENQGLIDLNKHLLAEAGIADDWTMRFRPGDIDRVAALADRVDPVPFADFARACDAHAPWVWKDPRLWLTIRFWRPFLNLTDTAFIVVRRDPLQSWISTTLRRQIQSPRHARAYEDGIHASLIGFLNDADGGYLDLRYEDLLTRPEAAIAAINDLSGTHLDIDHLKQVFRGRLYRRQHGWFNLAKAAAIYLKNYGKRHD